GVADFNPVDRTDNVMVSCGADDVAGRQLGDHEWEHVPVALARQRSSDVLNGLLRARHGCEPQLPQSPVGGGCRQGARVHHRHRLETQPMTLQRYGSCLDHWLTPPCNLSGVRLGTKTSRRCRGGTYCLAKPAGAEREAKSRETERRRDPTGLRFRATGAVRYDGDPATPSMLDEIRRKPVLVIDVD